MKVEWVLQGEKKSNTDESIQINIECTAAPPKLEKLYLGMIHAQ